MPGFVTRLDILKRTQPQRLLSRVNPLTKECREQFVTEESLTLFRDGVRRLPLVLGPVGPGPGPASFCAGSGTLEGRAYDG